MYLLKKFVGLGGGKPSNEDEGTVPIEGPSRSGSPNDDSYNNNIEESAPVEKAEDKKKRHKSKKKKKGKKVEDDAKNEESTPTSKDESSGAYEEKKDTDDVSLDYIPVQSIEDLTESSKCCGGSSTSRDISSFDISENGAGKDVDDIWADADESEQNPAITVETNDEEKDNVKEAIDFDAFWAEFDAEEGKIRKDSRSYIDSVEGSIMDSNGNVCTEKSNSENEPNNVMDAEHDSSLSPVENSSFVKDIFQHDNSSEDNFQLCSNHVEVTSDNSIPCISDQTKEDELEDFWADKEDQLHLSSQPIERKSDDIEFGETISESDSMLVATDDKLRSNDENIDPIDEAMNSLDEEMHSSNENRAGSCSENKKIRGQSPTLEPSSKNNDDQTTIDDFWGNQEDDPLPPVYQIRKSVDETALNNAESPLSKKGDDGTDLNSSIESVKSKKVADEIIAEPEDLSTLDLEESETPKFSNVESIASEEVADKIIAEPEDLQTDLEESETRKFSNVESVSSEPSQSAGEDSNSNSSESGYKKSSSSRDSSSSEEEESQSTKVDDQVDKIKDDCVSNIPKPPPWVEPLWAESSEVKKEVKEVHRRNFASALRDLEAPTRRRSVLLPDNRERILREERSSRVSESSADGDASEDDGDGIMDFLGKENDRAEARLAARRQARVEAREIRMRELERVQKEQQEEGNDRVFDLHGPPRSSTVSPRERPTSNNSYHSSRRSSEDSMEDGGLSLRDIRHELKEAEEKFRKSMIANAQLDNEKAALSYQVELLKDKLEDLEEAHSQLGREHRERCREHEALKRATVKLKEDLNVCRHCLEERDMLIAGYGLVIVGGEVDEKGELTPRTLVSAQSAEILESVGEGSLDVRLKTLAKDKNELLDEVRHLKLELEEERNRRRNDKMLTNGPIGDEIQQTLNDYRFRLQKSDQETSTLQATVARLESQVIRYKSAAETSEKAEDELKIEKRKLQREHRESIARIEELETANSHLQRRMDKLKNAKSTLLKEL